MQLRDVEIAARMEVPMVACRTEVDIHFAGMSIVNGVVITDAVRIPGQYFRTFRFGTDYLYLIIDGKVCFFEHVLACSTAVQNKAVVFIDSPRQHITGQIICDVNFLGALRKYVIRKCRRIGGYIVLFTAGNLFSAGCLTLGMIAVM